MLDAVTGKPIRVKVFVDNRGLIDLPASQMDAVSQLLEEHGVPHWRQTMITSSYGGPWMGTIVLRIKADPARAQEVLDSAP